MTDKDKIEKTKEPKAIQKWWKETLGELRKVSWPTPEDAWKVTRVVLMVMGFMAILLGFLDFVFSRVITYLLA